MTAAPDQREVETIRAFVLPTKRDRYVAFISSEKRRKEFVRELAHGNDFDPRYIIRLPKAAHTPQQVRQLLVAHGASDNCHLISEWAKLDKAEMSLEAALKEVIGSGMGTIICCIPGKLAFFENEDDRFVLERTTTKKQEPA